MNYTYELLHYFKHVNYDADTVQRLENNIAHYIEDLGGRENARHVIKLHEPYINEPEETFLNYRELCRGETVQVRSFFLLKYKRSYPLMDVVFDISIRLICHMK